VVYFSSEFWRGIQWVSELERTVDAAIRPLGTLDAGATTVGIPKEIYDAAQEAHKAGTVLAEFEAAIRPVIDTLTQLGHTQKLSIPVAKATAGGAIIET